MFLSVNGRVAPVTPRWDGDEQRYGVADASAFADDAARLVDSMRAPRWIAEEPARRCRSSWSRPAPATTARTT
jgi:hypothetical protein